MELLAFGAVALSLILIMDPFASVPMFISITKGMDKATINSYCNRAALVAGALLFLFIFAGQPLMDLFGISTSSFRVAGGLVLVLMGIELIFSLKFSKSGDEQDAPWVIIATPVMTGPGVITATIVLTGQYGYPLVVLAGLIALIVTWVLLRGSHKIMELIGENALNIISRIVGLLIAALGVELVFQGAFDWFMMQGIMI